MAKLDLLQVDYNTLSRKRIERTRNNCLQARVQLELRSGITSQFVQRQTEDRPCRILHGYPRPTNRQICQ